MGTKSRETIHGASVYRLDTILRLADGSFAMTSAHHYKAASLEFAEIIADTWVKARRLSRKNATSLRLVRADMIMAERSINEKAWSGSYVATATKKPPPGLRHRRRLSISRASKVRDYPKPRWRGVKEVCGRGALISNRK
jgi:hypothetical protein